jgi:hypothetical protein
MSELSLSSDLKSLMKKPKTTVLILIYSSLNHCLTSSSIVAMVNPFDLDTDNMTRITPFDILFPRKVFFKLPEFLQGIKTKLVFNDYLLFYEKNDEALKRLYEATGLVPRDNGTLYSFENINPEECEKKLLKIRDPNVKSAFNKDQE